MNAVLVNLAITAGLLVLIYVGRSSLVRFSLRKARACQDPIHRAEAATVAAVEQTGVVRDVAAIGAMAICLQAARHYLGWGDLVLVPLILVVGVGWIVAETRRGRRRLDEHGVTSRCWPAPHHS